LGGWVWEEKHWLKTGGETKKRGLYPLFKNLSLDN